VKKLDHLAKIYNSYDTFIIDLWGVMHNGIKLNPKAIEVVDNLMKNRKKVIFPKYWFGWRQKIESNSGIQPEWASIIDIS